MVASITRDEIEALLTTPDQRPAARELCYKALIESPADTVVRLLLAKSFYLDKLPEFCARELREILQYKKSQAVEKLLTALQDYLPVECTAASEAGKERINKTLAEIEFDPEFVDVLAQLEKEEQS